MMRDIPHPIQSRDIILKIDVEQKDTSSRQFSKSYVMSFCVLQALQEDILQKNILFRLSSASHQQTGRVL